ncbi:MAG TPA: hypothetical protein VNL77_20695 [Roseiflexaceae bacterium]|nr:hypothetical protein [Roseiflexaceae bacterium]
MSRLSALIALCVVMLATSLAPYQGAAQQAEAPKAADSRAEFNIEVPNSVNVKYPGAAGLGNQIFVSGNPGTDNAMRNATIWQKEDRADTFPDGVDIGDARGQTDYASAAVATNRFDNTIHAAWIDQDANRIYYRSRGLNTGWGTTRLVVATERNPYYVSVAVGSDGRIWVAWNESERARYRTSTDGGASWSETRVPSNEGLTGRVYVVAGPGGRAALTFAGANGNIYAGPWNGSEFEISRVTNKGSDDYFSTPTVAIDASGKLYVAWRNVQGSFGLFYSERQPDGSWPVSRLTGATVIAQAPIVADSQGNVHLMWISVAGGRELNYAFKPAGQPFESPVRVGGISGAIDNPGGAATLSSRAYGHAVTEHFTGRGLRTRYFLFSSIGDPCPGTIAFDDPDGAINSRTIQGTITPGAGCAPTQRKISLNSQNDSVAAEPYTSRFAVTVPNDQIGLCTQTVNVRLFQGSNPGNWFAGTIKVDPGDVPNPVNAQVTLENMYSSGKDVFGNGPSDGDIRFSRVPTVRLRILDTGDCSGLNTFSAPGIQNETIPSSNYTRDFSLPGIQGQGFPSPGVVNVPVNVVDKVGNLQTFNASIIFDPSDHSPNTPGDDGQGRPVLASGGEVAGDDTAAARLTILRTLTFSGIEVNDDLYTATNVPGLPANGEFWGVWVASEYLGPAGSPQVPENPDNPNLNYYPVKVASRTCNQAGCSFSIPWNLFTGLNFGPDPTKFGVYRVYVRFLDGAGNYSQAHLKAEITLDPGYRLPEVMMPNVYKVSN